MELTEQRVSEILRKGGIILGCVVVSLLVGWWVPQTHYLIVLTSLIALGLAFFAVVKPEVGIYGLLFFTQPGKIAGLGLPLPWGMTEYNLIFSMLVFVAVGEFALTKKWTFKLRERTIGNYLYIYMAVILVATLRAYQAFPHFDFVRSGLAIATRSSVITSQFIKPAMYMGAFYFGYNFAREAGQRRRFVIAIGICMVLYSMTMFLQILNIFPIFSGAAGGKERGGILGMSVALGVLLGMYMVLFLARKPYFGRGTLLVYGLVVSGISVVALASTLSRTGWVLGILSWLLLALTTRRKALMVLGVLSLAVLLATGPLWLPKRVTAFFEVSTVQARRVDDMLSGRMAIWQAVLEYVKMDPKLLIWGGGKFDFSVKGPDLGLPFGFAAHQNLLQVLVDEGLVGVVVVLGIFARIFLVLWRDWHNHPSEEVRSLARLLFIIAIVQFASGVEFDGRNISWYWFLLGMLLAAKETWRPEPTGETPAPVAVTQPRFVRAGAAPFRPARPTSAR